MRSSFAALSLSLFTGAAAARAETPVAPPSARSQPELGVALPRHRIEIVGGPSATVNTVGSDGHYQDDGAAVKARSER